MRKWSGSGKSANGAATGDPGGGAVCVRDVGPKGRDPAAVSLGLDSVGERRLLAYGAAARPRRQPGARPNPLRRCAPSASDRGRNGVLLRRLRGRAVGGAGAGVARGAPGGGGAAGGRLLAGGDRRRALRGARGAAAARARGAARPPGGGGVRAGGGGVPVRGLLHGGARGGRRAGGGAPVHGAGVGGAPGRALPARADRGAQGGGAGARHGRGWRGSRWRPAAGTGCG